MYRLRYADITIIQMNKHLFHLALRAAQEIIDTLVSRHHIATRRISVPADLQNPLMPVARLQHRGGIAHMVSDSTRLNAFGDSG